MTEHHGWIGNWSPGIGDPTVVGWLTVVMYLVAAWLSYRVVRSDRTQPNGLDASERLLWRALVIGLVFLCLNKQLDLQSAFTELGRIIAANQGWYVRRHEVQELFIGGIGLSVITATTLILFVAIRMPTATRFALFGSIALL